ncbi:PIN domain-containing protein [Streptomyces tsukubensis]|uniref:PIN domain-containing protein n=1 Tax=Streptomyces tsukubensis TaxID=83656 RepID=UPI00344D2581
MIVLDSNEMRLFLPGSAALQQLTAVAKRARHTIATTDMVLREVVRQHHARVISVAKALADAQREFNDAGTWMEGRAQVPFPDGRSRRFFAYREVRNFEEAIRNAYRVLPTLPEDALTALQWEADHRGPCRNGSGARDASIWLTAARACGTPDLDASGRPLPVIFVSRDNDFCVPGDATSLAEELRSENTERKMMTLKKGVMEVLADLGFPKRRVDAQTVSSRLDFQNALVDVAVDKGNLSPRHLDRIGEAETVFHLRKGAEAYKCQSDEVTLTSISGIWGIRFVIERLPRRPDGRGGGQRLLGAPMTIEATGLIVEDHEEHSVTIDIVPAAVW